MLLSSKLTTAKAVLLIAAVMHTVSAEAEPMHAIAMYGKPALEVGYNSLPYANPHAPQGGRIVFGQSGSFDSLNPFIIKGRAPSTIRYLVYEPLMGRNWDEPFTLYGLLAESVETNDDRNWVEYTLRPEARFSNGSPVTVEDVVWSFETLGTEGHPRYRTAWSKIDSVEVTGPRSVRFNFKAIDRELPLILGLRPILRKADWEGREFGDSSIEVPIGSGPYVLESFETGRKLVFRRNPDYWGNELGFNRGRHNIDELRYEYYGDGGIVFEAFKAGEIDTHREWNAAKWSTEYDFPAVKQGDVVKSIIPHQRPSGIRGFVFNTRQNLFKDWRVREALIHAFNFEFINTTLNDGLQPRIASYFSNSVLGMHPGPATGLVKSLLEKHRDELLPGALEGYALPVSDGSLRNRSNIRKAFALLEEAGWVINSSGELRNQENQKFSFEILLAQGASETLSIAEIYIEALKQLGIDARLTMIDSAQYKERTDSYDFDMAWYRRGMSLSPGNEQRLYWGSDGVKDPGTRNWMGINSQAVESMIDEILMARSRDEFIAAVRALDRLLTTGRYVIPVWYADHSRIAHRKELNFPERLPIYGDWLGFQPDVWWYEEQK